MKMKIGATFLHKDCVAYVMYAEKSALGHT